MSEVKRMSKKGLAARIISIACLAAVAGSAIGFGSFAKYHQNIGIAGTDGDDGSKNPRVAEFFFTAEVSKDGGAAFTTDELKDGVSLFSSAYSGTTGMGTEKGVEGNTVEAVNDDKVVAPGTHGGLEIKMEAGAAEDGKSHAETDAVVSLNVSQLSGTDAASTVPLIYGVDTDADGVDDKFYSEALTRGAKYTVNDPTGLGADGLALTEVTISGNLEDLAKTKSVYYFANGDAFYEIDEATGKGDKTKPVNAGTNLEGVFDVNIHWYWAYELTGPNAGDEVDTALAKQAHIALHSEDEAAKAAAKAATDLRVSIYASATQVD